MQGELKTRALIEDDDRCLGTGSIAYNLTNAEKSGIAQMTALHQVLKVDAELTSLELVHALRLCPHSILDSILNRAHQPPCDTPLDVLIELAGSLPLRLLEARIARKENIGEVIIARICDCRDIHTALKRIQIMRLDRCHRLRQHILGTLNIVSKVPRKH